MLDTGTTILLETFWSERGFEAEMIQRTGLTFVLGHRDEFLSAPLIKLR